MKEGSHISEARSWSRLDGVDVLRGLAILFVLLNHVNMRLVIAGIPYTNGLPAQLVSILVGNAQYGVQMFFAVSGFLITSTSLRRWKSLSGVSVRNFYGLRFARIAPLLLLLLTVLSILSVAGVRDFVVAQRVGGLGRALIAALTFHINVLEARHGYLPGNWDVLWSLSVEETFYFFFPLISRYVGHSKLFIALLIAFVVLGPIARTVFDQGNDVWREYSYLGGMDAIALGCLTAIVLSKTRVPGYVTRLLGAAGTLVLVFILGFSARAEAWGLVHTGLDMTAVALGTCMAIAAAAQSQWRSPRFVFPLLMLGQRSYEIYLTHMFVVFAFFGLFVTIGKPMSAVPVLFLAVIGVASLLGYLVARFYSEPMNRILRERFREGRSELGAVVDAERAT